MGIHQLINTALSPTRGYNVRSILIIVAGAALPLITLRSKHTTVLTTKYLECAISIVSTMTSAYIVFKCIALSI